MPKYNPTWVQKDRIARVVFPKYFLKKLVIKSLLFNASESFDSFNRMCWSLSFHNTPKNSSIATFRRSCGLTNSPRSIFRMFKMSRHSLKKYASCGLVAGMRKSSF